MQSVCGPNALPHAKKVTWVWDTTRYTSPCFCVLLATSTSHHDVVCHQHVPKVWQYATDDKSLLRFNLCGFGGVIGGALYAFTLEILFKYSCAYGVFVAYAELVSPSRFVSLRRHRQRQLPAAR
jgi:hypothetical protein